MSTSQKYNLNVVSTGTTDASLKIRVTSLEEKTKVVEKTFKAFETNQKLKVSDKITKEMLNTTEQNSLDYYFRDASLNYCLDFYWDVQEQKFYVNLFEEVEEYIEYISGEYMELIDLSAFVNVLPFEYWVLEEVVDETGGNGLLGTWTETQLTAQEVYDKINTGIGYRTAKVIVEEVDNSYFKINLPEIIDIFNGNLLIKKSDGNILRIVWDQYLKFYSSAYEIENIEIDGCALGNDGAGTPNDITIFIIGNLSFMLSHGEEIEIMYFVSPFASYYEV